MCLILVSDCVIKNLKAERPVRYFSGHDNELIGREVGGNYC